MKLALRSILFTIVVPGLGAGLAPWWILSRSDPAARVMSWPAVIPIAAGAALYLWCLWLFASVGRGTPNPWDAPREVVQTGPYRWVRNPIYIAALTVVLGEAWLFLSLRLLIYAILMAVCFHLFVVAYEEPTLRHRFGGQYADYLQTVPRWIPHKPRA